MKNTNTTANEYRNTHGLTALQYGEQITATDTGKIYLTAVNCAISATRIKRDHASEAVAAFLDRLDSLLKYAWANIDSDGIIHLFDAHCKEFCEDYIQDCVLALLAYDGKEYTLDIMREVRNSCDRQLYRVSEQINNTVDTDTAPTADYRPIYSNTDFHNKSLIQAIKQCDFDEVTLDIIVRISNGESRVSIAKDMCVTEGAIRKRYNKAVAQLQKIMVK